VLHRLYEIAQNEHIFITTKFSDTKNKSSILNDGNAWAISVEKALCEIEEKQCLAHELGHYFTGSVYSEASTAIQRAKCEYRAGKWMIKTLVPLPALRVALADGLRDPWELAEHFSVSEDVIHKAFYIYQLQGEFFGPDNGCE